MNADLMRDLRKGVERAAIDDGIRAVLITGAGRGFCSGADLDGRQSGGLGLSDAGAQLRERYHPIILTLRRMR